MAVEFRRVGTILLVAGGLWAGTARAEVPEKAIAKGGTESVPVSTEARKAITGLPPAPNAPESLADLKKIQARVEAVVKEAVPATVAILLDGAQGSGVIVSKDGYVLTAGHVSGTPGQTMWVVLADGKRVKAKALGANNGIDSGMVKITEPAPKGEYPFVPVGSAKKLSAGQWVVAVGHPGGYRKDRPPVVRLGRVLLANNKFIGTDSPLISGDSGGPVFDLDGKLIGINSRIGPAAAANIHVPIDTFTETWDRLAKGDEWGGGRSFFGGRDRPEAAGQATLGVKAFEDSKGALVKHVHAGMAAEKGGVHAGDVITKYNGQAIKSRSELENLLRKSKPGDSVKLEILRDAKIVEVAVTLGKSQ